MKDDDKTGDAVLTTSVTPACTVIGKEFPLGGKTCELLKFQQQKEGLVNDILLRGKAAKASMDEAAFQYFWKYRDQVPSEYCNRIFVFPDTPDAYGVVRHAYRNDSFWYHHRHRLGRYWHASGVLVRLS